MELDSGDNSTISNTKNEFELLNLYKNISNVLVQLQKLHDKDHLNKSSSTYYDDNSNAWMYILFVLTFYAFSIVVLMVKYIKREREGSKLEFYYNEFVKREWYKDKNLYDNKGRRIRYNEDGSKVIKTERRTSRCFNDPDLFLMTDNEIEEEEVEVETIEKKPEGKPKKSVVLCLGTASTMGMVSMGDEHSPKISYVNTGARPKRSSLKNWPPPERTNGSIKFPRRGRASSFHQQSLDDALEMRNLTFDEERELALMGGRSRLLNPIVPLPDNIDEEDESPRISDNETDSNLGAFDFVPTKSKLAFCKVDETMQVAPPLIHNAVKRKQGLPKLTIKLRHGQSDDSNSLHSVTANDDQNGTTDVETKDQSDLNEDKNIV